MIIVGSFRSRVGGVQSGHCPDREPERLDEKWIACWNRVHRPGENNHLATHAKPGSTMKVYGRFPWQVHSALFLVGILFSLIGNAANNGIPLEKIANDSDIVGFGTVIKRDSYHVDPKNGNRITDPNEIERYSFSIWTDTTFLIEEFLKGPTNVNEVTVTLYGGGSDNYRVTTSVLIIPNVSDEVAFFLREADGSRQIQKQEEKRYIYSHADYGLYRVLDQPDMDSQILLPYGRHPSRLNDDQFLKNDAEQWLTTDGLRSYFRKQRK